jgi:hypothetical protein
MCVSFHAGQREEEIMVDRLKNGCGFGTDICSSLEDHKKKSKNLKISLLFSFNDS